MLLDAAGNELGGPYATDGLGEIRLQDKLAPGEYIFRETKSPAGYTFDLDAEGKAVTDYPFTVEAEGENAEVLITAYNRRITGSLTITKKVQNADGTLPDYQHTQMPFTFTVQLLPLPAPTDAVTYAVTNSMGVTGEAAPIQPDENGLFVLALKHGETAVFAGIPTGTQYTVTESPAEGYTTTSEGSFGVITEEGTAAVFTNTVYQDPSQVGTLIVKKTVEPAPSDTEALHSFNFVVRYPQTADNSYRADTFTLTHGQAHTIPDIPAGTTLTVAEQMDDPATTELVEYPEDYYPHMTETTVTIPAGETVTVEFVNAHNVDDSKAGSLEISKTVLPPSPTEQEPDPQPDTTQAFVFDVSFSKYPDPIQSEGGTTPVYYTYTVTDAAGNTTGPYDFKHDQSTAINLRHGETALFENIPHGVEYTVAERTAEGFTAEVNSVSGTIAGGRKTMTLSGEGVIEFGTIYYHSAGIYKYTIYEQQDSAEGWMYDNSRYLMTVTVTEEADGLKAATVLQKHGHSVKEAVFTNLYNKAGWDERVVIEGVKYWDHGSNPKLMRPTSIRVFLYGNGQYVAEKYVTEADGWEYMFVVPKFTANGTPITYVIDELEIEHYSKHVDGYDLLNTYVGEDTPSGPRPKPTKKPDSFSPDTGDTTNIPLWTGIFAACLTGMCILLAAIMSDKRKASRKKHR